ncbi:DUF4202 domain-containing protein [Frigidibacter sp. MR17.14]|uniref:DUF4202 domain-containing protein n=1 Tax=Frigidibacter sp. MR17.14 TaxID=3126509 RepID=UPI003012A8AA
MSRLAQVLARIDAANDQDPSLEDGQPANRLYGERMSAELARLFPEASEVLQICARGQHVERWLLPREDYPEGRAGYLAWRQEQGRRHAARIEEFMADAGYGAEEMAQAGRMLRKEGIKRDAEVQALEDVICFVFLRWYFGDFATEREPAGLLRIVEKTARKMSAEGRARALAEFELPEPFAAAFRD